MPTSPVSPTSIRAMMALIPDLEAANSADSDRDHYVDTSTGTDTFQYHTDRRRHDGHAHADLDHQPAYPFRGRHHQPLGRPDDPGRQSRHRIGGDEIDNTDDDQATITVGQQKSMDATGQITPRRQPRRRNRHRHRRPHRRRRRDDRRQQRRGSSSLVHRTHRPRQLRTRRLSPAWTTGRIRSTTPPRSAKGNTSTSTLSADRPPSAWTGT